VDALASAHSLILFGFHSAITKAVQSPSFRIFVLKPALIRSRNPSRLLERHPESAAAEATKQKARVTYQVSEQPSTRVQEEEFAKQLRLARYLAAASLPSSRPLEPAPETKAPKREGPVAKAKPKATGKKAREEELAKERRRAGRAGQKLPSSDPRRAEKHRSSPGR
jgi:hypothetical protein